MFPIPAPSRLARLATAAVCAAILLLGTAGRLPAQPGLPPPPPQQVLEDHGLIRQGTGGLWLVASEVDLQQQLDSLSGDAGQMKQYQQQLLARIDQNAKDWTALSRTKKRLKSAKNDAQKRSLRNQKKQLEEKCVDPQELAVEPEVIHLATERNRLLLTVLSSRRCFDDMTKRYAELRENQDVKKALMDLKQDARLGPARSYDDAMQQLEEVENLVTADWQPLLRQSGLWRVNGIVADRAATTFTWEPKGGDVVLTGSAAKLAGLPLGGADVEKTQVGGRQVSARRLVLPCLRFGTCVLRDVKTLVLPPEAEDLGSRIGPKAFGDLDVVLVPERLRLVIRDTR